ncbi:hypothetical protein TI39_contig339g00011 [Zymoseptoria brevis]|uniref:Uncharacterized protein n=1 Tax=Zymoseptoria brevis TaxID=1047168 RepID=A0A0F4GT54_9PEZI|nr:hypothetical protein TI39_contig339g00011 [Zymoseptoria brevis]
MSAKSSPINIPATSARPTETSHLIRHCTFTPTPTIIDEKFLTHDGRVTPHFAALQALAHHDKHDSALGLGLAATITHIQYGLYHTQPACLIGFAFRFHDSSPARQQKHHFEKVEVDITFCSTTAPSSTRVVGADEPTIVDIAPNHDIPPTRPFKVDAQVLCEHAHRTPNKIKFFLHSDPASASHATTSAPPPAKEMVMDFTAAIVVTYQQSASIQATVDVKCGPVFELHAQPWAKEGPLVLEPGVEVGERLIGTKRNGAVDFADLGGRDGGEC